MKSKKSFCNRTMFWKDIIRLWPLWAIGIAMTMLVFAVPFFTNSLEKLRYVENAGERLEALNEMRNNIADMMGNDGIYLMFMLVMAIVSAVLVFQYLNRQSSSYMLHSLPVSRKTMYMTHYLSGFMMYLFPFLLLWCVLGVQNLLFGIHMGAAMLGCVLETVMIALFFYSLACFVVMLSNSSMMSLFLYGVINVMVYVFYNMAETVIDIFTYGNGYYHAGVFDWKGLVTIFTPYAYFSDILSWQSVYDYSSMSNSIARSDDGLLITDFHYGSVLLCLLYLIPAIVFFVAALLLYRRRKLERVDDNLVFLWSRVFYRVVFCCCGSYIFTWFMYYLTYPIFSHLITYRYAYLVGVVFLLIGAIVCYLVCDMILAKSFFIWKRLSLVQMGLITAGILVVFAAGVFTYSGQSTSDASRIESVDVNFNDTTFHITQKERFDALMEHQRDVMKQGNQKLVYDADHSKHNDSLHENESSMCGMGLVYTLKNKGELYREYEISTYEKELLTDIITFLNNPKYLMDTVLPELLDRGRIINMSYYRSSSYEDYAVEVENQNKMYDAIMKDIEEGHIIFGNIYQKNVRGFVDAGRRHSYVDIVCVADPPDGALDELYNDYLFDNVDYDYETGEIKYSFVITDECTHVLKVLEQEELMK